MSRFEIKARVEIFPQKGGWHYVMVPLKYSEKLKPLANRGLVAVSATVGSSTWRTSLLPMGDGSQFIPLPMAVRRKEKIALGDEIRIEFVPR